MNISASSFVCFIYPFAFDARRKELRDIVYSQAGCCGRQDAWNRRSMASDGILPGVLAFFDPPAGRKPQATHWKFSKSLLESADGLGAGTGTTWTLVTPKRSIPIHLENVELTVFAQGIGLLTLDITTQSSERDDWLDLVHFGRLIHRPRVLLSIQRRIGIDTARGEARTQPFFPGLAGGLARHPEGQGHLGDLVSAALRTVCGTEVSENWWCDVFSPGQAISYTALFVDDATEDVRWDLTYRLQNCFSADRVVRPAESSVDVSDALGVPALEYAAGQKFLFALDGSSFVAFDPPQTPFFRETLPARLAGSYLLGFQMALFQRFLLVRLADDISRGWHREGDANILERETLLRNTRDQLLTFTAGGYFSQITQVQRQHACYRRWQECFGIAELYQRTRQAVGDMHDYLVQQRDEGRRDDFQKLDLRLKQLALLFGPPALTLSFAGILAFSTESYVKWLASGALVGGLLLGWIAWWLIRRGQRE